jgi:hypothetical protein
MLKKTLIVLSFLVFNQIRAEVITINWTKSSDGTGFTFNNITSVNGENQAPYYAYAKWFDKKIKDFTYNLQILETKALNSEELAFYKNLNPPSAPSEIKKASNARDKGVAKVLFDVIIKNANNQWLKIVKFNIDISNVVYEENIYASKKQYKNGTSSVLASGRWFKMAISSSGIYKIDKNFLISMGVDVNTINPKNIKVYGSGGMLPEKVKEQTFHDLPENAIYVAGENDNTFNDGDYVLFYAKGPHEWKYDENSSIFKHYYNFFSDVSYYFITFDGGAGKRILDQNQALGTATDIATTFDDFGFYENDLVNLNKSGRVWLDKPLNISSA